MHRFSLVLFAAVCFAPAAIADVCTGPLFFEPPLPFTTGLNPAYIVVGDFNEDGHPDMAVTNIDLAHAGASSRVAIRLGLGGRTFAPAVSYPVPADPLGIVARDFNSDGIVDLAVASTRQRKVSILLGRGSGSIGDGTFDDPVSYSVGVTAFQLEAADFNLDGILDLAVSSDSANVLKVLKGQGSGGVGDGTFGPPVTFTLNRFSTGLVAVDVNRDSIPDLVATQNAGGQIAVLLGTGNATIDAGSFASPAYFPAGISPFDIAVEDFNDDGLLDLAVANATSGGTALLKGFGNGAFQPPTFLASGNSTAVAPIDANRDGITDLAVAANVGFAGAALRLFIGQGAGGVGDGTFGAGTDYPLGADPYQIAVADMDPDNTPDLIVSSLQTDHVSLLSGSCRPDPRAPVLTDVRDVPNDQGGRVFLTWTASSLDVTGGSVNSYRVWRRIPTDLALAMISSTFGRADLLALPTPQPDGSEPIVYWEALVTLPAQRMPGYGYTAPTTQDSMRFSNPYTAFFISALTSNIDVFYSSNVDSGYSVDNIPPRRPADLTAARTESDVVLHWSLNDEADWAGYRLHRGTQSDFVPSDENLIATPTQGVYIDTNAGSNAHYKLCATDTHENESEFASADPPTTTSVGDGSSASFALHELRPNPSLSGTLAVHFSLRAGPPGRIDVIDLAGRRVFTQALGNLGPGDHVVSLGEHRRLPTGVYLVRLSQGGSVQESKAIVLR